MDSKEFRKMSKEKLLEQINKMDYGKENKVFFKQRELEEIRQFAIKVVSKKMNEEVHQNDCSREVDRWIDGYLGEKAVEKFLGIKFSDKSVGDSEDYAVPDLSTIGYKLGVKTCRFPNFPVINRNIHTPQIFVLISSDRRMATILGLADVSLLKKNLKDKSNDDLIYAKSMLDRKTAFSLITELKQIKSIEDISKYKR